MKIYIRNIKIVTWIPVFLLLLSGTGAEAQILDRLKKQLKEQGKKELQHFVKKSVESAKDTLRNRIIQWSEDYDPAELNYAISYSDQSGMFEAEDKFETYKRSIIGFAVSPGRPTEKLADRAAELNPEDFNRSGELMYATNHFKSAEKAYMAALFLVNQSGKSNTETEALIRSNLGLLYQTTGMYAMSEEYTEAALEIRSKLNNPAALGASYNNLGVLKKEQGVYDEAGRYLDKALELTEQSLGRNSTAYGIILNNQANLQQVLGDYENAKSLQLKALDVTGNTLKEKSANYVRMQVNLAMIYQLLGQNTTAEKIYLEAMKLKRRRLGSHHPDYAVMLRNLAGLYIDNGKEAEAGPLLAEAVKILNDKLGSDHPATAAAKLDQAKFLLLEKNTEEAGPLIDQVLEVAREKLDQHHPLYNDALEAKAVWSSMKGQWNEAISTYEKVLDEYLYQVNRYFPALTTAGQSAFWKKVHPKFLRFYDLSLHIAERDEEIPGMLYRYHVTTKALLLNSSLKIRNEVMSSGDPELISKYNHWEDLKRYLGTVYSMSREQIAKDQINVDSVENVASSLEKEISGMMSTFGTQFTEGSITDDKVRSSLDPGEAAVEIIRVPHFEGFRPDTLVSYIALVIRPDKEKPLLVRFENGYELENRHLLAYRSAMQWAMEEAPFLDQFWNGLADATSGIPIVYVSVDGVYNFINLNTLQGANGHFLIESKEIRYVTNTREIIRLKKEAGSIHVKKQDGILLGNPKYDLGFNWDKMKELPVPELPGTKQEVEEIYQIIRNAGWQTEMVLGDQAKESRIHEIRHPFLLHLATHGYFLKDLEKSGERIFGVEPQAAEQNPLLRSGLLLAGADNTIQNLDTVFISAQNDGILNAYEAMLLDLQGTRLVTLSACETGIGEVRNGEGVYGLLRAFQIAGSHAVMISLWQVSDEVTRMLMSAFYRNWLITGDEQKALIYAQREVKKSYKAPFYWGAFILVK